MKDSRIFVGIPPRRIAPILLPTPAPTVLARAFTDEATAKRIATILHESLPPDDTAAAAFESDDGRWCVEVHFSNQPDEAAIRALVQMAGNDAAGANLTFETVAAIDWVTASLAGLTPVDAGRFRVHGSHDRAGVGSNRIGLEIEAALAFGTGHHGTTRGCLLALDALARHFKPQRVLDVGTGTGVLAIAAARRWHVGAIASDIDPVAVVAARANAALNRAATSVVALRAAGVADARIGNGAPYDLIFANILLGPLVRMATPIAALLAPGGYVVLSGLLPVHAHAALAAYRARGLVLERRFPLDQWMTLLMRKPLARKPRSLRGPGDRG